MTILGITFDLFGSAPEQAVIHADYYADLLCGERLEVYNPVTGHWSRGIIKDVAEGVYVGERDIYRAYWCASDGSFSEWLLLDDVLSELGLA